MSDANQNGNGAANPEPAQPAAQPAPEATPEPAKEEGKTVPHAALHSERERRKAAEAELEKFKAAEAQRVEEEQKAQGQYKELLEGKEVELKAAVEERDSFKEKLEAYENAAQERVKSSLEAFKRPEDKQLAESLLKDKPLSEQESLIPTLLERFGSPKNVNASPKGGETQTASKTKETVDQLEEKLQAAIKDGKTSEAIKLTRKLETLKAE